MLVVTFIGKLEVEVGLCGVHIERQVIQHYSSKFKNSSYLDTAKYHVSLMRNCTGSQVQMVEFGRHMLTEWRYEGEMDVAKTFEQEYCTHPYHCWGVNSFPDVKGNPIDNNPMESEHRRQKRNNFGVGSRVRTRLSFFVLNQVPMLLSKKGKTHANRPIDCKSTPHDTRWPRAILLKAKELVQTMKDTTSSGASSSSK